MNDPLQLLRAGLPRHQGGHEQRGQASGQSPGKCARAPHGLDPFAWQPDRTQSLTV